MSLLSRLAQVPDHRSRIARDVAMGPGAGSDLAELLPPFPLPVAVLLLVRIWGCPSFVKIIEKP